MLYIVSKDASHHAAGLDHKALWDRSETELHGGKYLIHYGAHLKINSKFVFYVLLNEKVGKKKENV